MPVQPADMQPTNIISREGANLVWQTEGIIGADGLLSSLCSCSRQKTVKYTCRGQISKVPYWELSRWLIKGTVHVEGTDETGSFELWLTKGDAVFALEEAYQEESAQQSAVTQARALNAEDDAARQAALQVYLAGLMLCRHLLSPVLELHIQPAHHFLCF